MRPLHFTLVALGLAITSLGFVACGPSSAEEACIDACLDWADYCDADDLAPEEECAEGFCDEELSDPEDCEECFDCARDHDGEIIVIGEVQGQPIERELSYCAGDGDIGVRWQKDWPCDAICERC